MACGLPSSGQLLLHNVQWQRQLSLLGSCRRAHLRLILCPCIWQSTHQQKSLLTSGPKGRSMPAPESLKCCTAPLLQQSVQHLPLDHEQAPLHLTVPGALTVIAQVLAENPHFQGCLPTSDILGKRLSAKGADSALSLSLTVKPRVAL